MVVVLEVERDIATELIFEGLPGSLSPRWNASGDSLYFAPYLLDLDDSQKGLYEYRVKERWIGLPNHVDKCEMKQIGLVGGRIDENGPTQGLVAQSVAPWSKPAAAHARYAARQAKRQARQVA